ncbi:30S ribosomal protein S7, partial [Desulfobulbus sp. US2]|nr:30S ribosomal protein S7 [Desulfobulbus sp. US2]
MPRKKLQNKRAVEADPKYNSVLVSRFTNGLMLDGKKSLARRMFYDA